ncbi:magnesium transporter CorA family protein [Sphingomonas mesophila]|uniref:magnesium transporter CorA family protein n=1 Tax=Sphingomonas mesophila TaxID=2303576 RepID=UPI0013C2B89E|nr:magnesium transporter CorA family protein [Sphingomonas mesophila]
MLRLFGPGCPIAPIAAADLAAVPEGTIWLDLLNPTEAEEKLAEAALGQNIPTREDLEQIEPSSRLYEQGGVLFLTAAVIDGIEEGHPTADPIGFILSDKLLVTVRYIDPDPFLLLAEHLYGEPETARNPLNVLVQLFDTIVDELADQYEHAGAEVEKLSSRVFERNLKRRDKETHTERRLEAILLRIGQVQRLLAEIRQSTVSISRMMVFFANCGPIERGNYRARVDSFNADLKALVDHSAFLNDNLTFLLDASLGLISLEQNAVMKVFSVFAVIFMPPTLIAGVYGMNFERMPELGWIYGYPMALGLILVSAVVPYLIARKSGWL